MRKKEQVLLAAAAFVAGCEMALAAGLIRKLQKYAVKAAAAAFPAEEDRDAAAEEAAEERDSKIIEVTADDGEGRNAGTV